MTVVLPQGAARQTGGAQASGALAEGYRDFGTGSDQEGAGTSARASQGLGRQGFLRRPEPTGPESPQGRNGPGRASGTCPSGCDAWTASEHLAPVPRPVRSFFSLCCQGERKRGPTGADSAIRSDPVRQRCYRVHAPVPPSYAGPGSASTTSRGWPVPTHEMCPGCHGCPPPGPSERAATGADRPRRGRGAIGRVDAGSTPRRSHCRALNSNKNLVYFSMLSQPPRNGPEDEPKMKGLLDRHSTSWWNRGDKGNRLGSQRSGPATRDCCSRG